MGNAIAKVPVISKSQLDENLKMCIRDRVVLLSHKKPDGHVNVKVEFGEGE